MIFCVQSVLRLFVGAGLVCKKSSNGCTKPQKCLGQRSPLGREAQLLAKVVAVNDRIGSAGR